MTAIETIPSRASAAACPSAVAWIDDRHATVVRISADARISTREIDRGGIPEPTYLTRVVDAIGNRERVMILGPSSTRLALEREYVAIYHRPDRLVDVEPATTVDREGLVEKVRLLAQ